MSVEYLRTSVAKEDVRMSQEALSAIVHLDMKVRLWAKDVQVGNDCLT